MKESERQTLLNALSEPALLVDSEGKLRAANEPAREAMPSLTIGELAALHFPEGVGHRKVPMGDDQLWIVEVQCQVKPSGSIGDLGEAWMGLFENEAVSMVLVGPDNRILCSNESFSRWACFSREELLGMSATRFVHPDDVESVGRRIKARMMGLDVSSVNDYRGVNGKGEVFEIRVGTMLVPGTPNMVYTVLDIQPEVRVAELNARYAMLLESCGVGITVIDLDSTINYANGRFQELTGYTSDELIGKMKGFDMLTPESRRLAIQHTEMRLQNHPDYVQLKELDVVCKDGTVLQTLSMNTPVPGTSHLMISFIDISQRKQVQKELADRLAHEELLSQVTSRFLNLTADMHEPRLQEAIDLIRSRYGVDRLSVHVFRDGSNEISSFTSAALDAKPSLLRDPDQSPLWQLLRSYAISVLLRPGLPPPPGFDALSRRMEDDGLAFFYAMPHKAGSHRFLLSLESRWETSWSDRDFSNLDTLSMVVANVVERIDAEQSRSTIERKLWEAHKLESVGVLAGGIAHDFNNMLVAMLGNAEMARTSMDNIPFVEECLDDLLVAGDRARDLVSQILMFSRQTEVEAKPVSLFRVCEEAVAMLRASIPTTVEINADLKATSGVVTGNFTRMLQVVMNLCTNAFQAIHATGRPGEIRLTLSKATGLEHDTLEPDRAYYKVVVEDSGHGVPEHLLPRIFDPFFTTKKPGEGTGMGLSVVHGIVTSYEGAIQAENRHDGGARFSVFFPASAESEEVLESPKTEDIASGKGETVLVVDDDPGVLKLMRSMLISLNYQVLTSIDPEEALQLYAEKADHLDLVITDLTMPKLTGNDVARAIKHMDPDTTVIACSGYSRSGIDMDVIDGFIAKPFQRAELSEIVRSAIERRLHQMEI